MKCVDFEELQKVCNGELAALCALVKLCTSGSLVRFRKGTTAYNWLNPMYLFRIRVLDPEPSDGSSPGRVAVRFVGLLFMLQFGLLAEKILYAVPGGHLSQPSFCISSYSARRRRDGGMGWSTGSKRM